MSVYDAEPRDVYVDSNGDLWRVTWTCPEPSLQMERVDKGPCERDSQYKMSGGVGGLMWQEMRRIYRHEPKQNVGSLEGTK